MRQFLTTLLVVSVMACGGDSPAAPDTASMAGVWSLLSIDDTPLPYVLSQTSTTKLELLSDVFTLGSDGRFTEQSIGRETNSGVVTADTATDAGTYTVTGGSAVFRFFSTGGSATASVKADTFTVSDNTTVFKYTR
ncbi:MAG TPA: hypothetical protein VH277_14910 [Gemmatimonadaceae bacterium]|jgi:hypothetical protein|nr:hypothetical protein [Gemmatimonadaceae bacterium]